MPVEVFARGIPISALTGRARQLAEQLDQNPLIRREPNSNLNSDHVEADEALAGLHSLDNWSDAGDRAILHHFATILGVTPCPSDVAQQPEATEEVDAKDVVNDIDIILTSITQTSEVNILQVTNNHVEFNDPKTGRLLDIEVLSYQSLRDNQIAVDIDAHFFCRASWNGQPLMSVGQDEDGKRYLFGVPRDGRSALPKDSQLWLCHPASGLSVALHTDSEGRFAAELPPGLSGSVTIARVDGQNGVGAQIALPGQELAKSAR